MRNLPCGADDEGPHDVDCGVNADDAEQCEESLIARGDREDKNEEQAKEPKGRLLVGEDEFALECPWVV